MYDVLEVAKYIIHKCDKERWFVSNLSLQKLLYFVQAEFLVATNAPCFNEDIVARDYGPVIPEVYHKYKLYGSYHIPVIKNELDSIGICSTDRKMIDGILKECSNYSSTYLVKLTQNQDPWRKAYSPYYEMVISKKSIKEFFQN